MHKRRSAVLAALMAAPLVVVGTGGPAQAADTFQCATTAPIFSVGTEGVIRRYPYTKVGRSDVAPASGVQIGQGWAGYGRVLGGPGGRIYGISASAGMARYRYTGGTWELHNGDDKWQISSSFKAYAGAAYRNKITIDEIGDVYAITSTGQLQMWRFDEATGQWVIGGRVLDTGWDKYDLIVAAGPGVIYAREGDKLFRYRYEATSQRWIMYNRQVGTSGWAGFTRGMFSAGGDTLFGIQAGGNMFHYRWREDTGTWVFTAVASGTGWSGHLNDFATTDSCKLTERHIPARPAIAPEPYAQVVAVQGRKDGTAVAPIEYVFAQAGGRLRHGYQENPDNFTVQWNNVTDPGAFVGRPALVPTGTGALQLLAHKDDSDIVSFTREASPSTTFGAGTALGGAMRSHPAAVRLSDNTVVAFAIDAAGALWFRPQGGTDSGLLPWRSLGGNLTGDLTVKAGLNGTAAVFALDADGTPVTATYSAVTKSLSTWTELGGSGFTGPVAVVVLPGPALRVYARGADGKIVTQRQTNGVFPGVWAPVGDFTAAGAPAAVLDPELGKLVVVARGADNEIWRSYEETPASGNYGTWQKLNTQFPDPSATDPAITEYSGGNGSQTYMIVFRNQNDAIRTYTRESGSSANSSPAKSKKAATPAFTGRTVPVPK